MRSGDFRHDGEAQTGTRRFDRATAPKPIEDAVAILAGNAGPSIGYHDSPGYRNGDSDLRRGRSMMDCILHQIAKGISDRVGVTADPDRDARRFEAD